MEAARSGHSTAEWREGERGGEKERERERERETLAVQHTGLYLPAHFTTVFHPGYRADRFSSFFLECDCAFNLCLHGVQIWSPVKTMEGV